MKYLQLTSDGRFLTFRDANDYVDGCIEVPDDFQAPDNLAATFDSATMTFIEPVQPQPSIDDYKKYKLNEINGAFVNAMVIGVIDFTIPSSGIVTKIDARRDGVNNDLENVKGLIDYMQVNNLTTIMFRCNDDIEREFTLNDLVELSKALLQYGLGLYQKKHALEDAVKNATTIEEVMAITW